jgi:hypothetical protein
MEFELHTIVEAKMMMVAPPIGLEPMTDWLTASASDFVVQSQLLYRTELRRQRDDYLTSLGVFKFSFQERRNDGLTAGKP